MEKVANLSVLHTGTNYTIFTTWYREEWCIRVIDGGNKVRYKALPAVTIEAALMEMLVFVSRMLQAKYAREQLAQGCRWNFSRTHPRTQDRRAILLGSYHPRLHRRRHLLHPVHLFLSGDSSANNAPAAGLGD